jgi:hypothetical protein
MLTAEQLQIKPWEYYALIRVRDYLASAKTPNVQDKSSRGASPVKDDVKFHMNFPIQPFHCGTAFCIGGFVALYKEKQIIPDAVEVDIRLVQTIDYYVFHGRSRALYDLFFPHTIRETAWDDITAEQAVKAIDSFLETGDPNWEEVVNM